MSPRFTQSFKIQAVEKALNRQDNTTLKEVADSLGVGLSSLTRWTRQPKNQELESISRNEVGSMKKEKRPQDWTLEERLNMIISCGALDDQALSEYCREQGIYPHHLAQWKLDFTNDRQSGKPVPRSEVKTLKYENKVLKKELNRKDKALAGTAALLVLQKKSQRDLGKRRGQLTMSNERTGIVTLVTQA